MSGDAMEVEMAGGFTEEEDTVVDKFHHVSLAANAQFEALVSKTYLELGIESDDEGVTSDQENRTETIIEDDMPHELQHQAMSFTAKQAKLEVAGTINDQDKGRQGRRSSTKDGKGHTQKVVLYTRQEFLDTSHGRIRIELFQSTGGTFEKISQVESPEFAIFTITTDPLHKITLRIVYLGESDHGQWVPFGYVTSDLETILEQEAKDGALQKRIRSSTRAEHIGTIIMTAEVLKSSPFNAYFAIGIKNHTSKNARFLSIQRLIRGMGMITVYTTTLPASQGIWEPFKIPLRRLCNGDVFADICFIVKEVDNSGKHTVIGSAMTTVAHCEQNQGQYLKLELNGQPVGNVLLDIKKCVVQKFHLHKSVKSKEASNEAAKMDRLARANTLELRTIQKEKARNSVPGLHYRSFTSRNRQNSMNSRPSGFWTTLFHDLRLWLETQPVMRLVNRLPIRRSVVSISMKFGSGVSAFFSLYNWVMMLNLFLCIVWLAMVISPQASHMNRASNAKDSIAAIFGVRTPTERSTALWAWYGDYTTPSTSSSYHDIISDRNCCDGTYPDDFFDSHMDDTIGRAYAWAVVITIVVSFLHITYEARQTHNALDSPFNSISGELKYKFTLAAFGGWDHMCGTSKFQKAQTTGICQEFKMYLKASELADLRMKSRRTSRTARLLLVLRRCFFMFLSGVVAAGAIALIVWVASEEEMLTNKFTFLPAAILTGINTVVPTLIAFCVKNEKWDDIAFENQNEIGRQFLLKVANIYTFYYQMRIKSTTEKLDSTGYQCVQDLVGNSFLRLFVVDCFFDCFHTFFWPLYRHYILGSPHHFVVRDNVLSLMYRQLIVWTAIPYCPIMPVAAFVGNYVCFTWRAFSCQHLSSPSSTPWPEAKARLFFLKMMLLTCVAALAPEIHFLYSHHGVRESGTDFRLACGPHINWNNKPRLSSVFTYLINWERAPDFIRQIMLVVFHPIFLVVVILMLLIILIWLQKYLAVMRQEVRSLTTDLEDEHHDKMALLRNASITL